MAAPASRNDIARRLAGIAAEAGLELSRLQVCGCASVLKSDGSPVSDADIAAEAVISKRLAAAFPDVPVISEENAESHAHAGAERFFLVDPLDGTKAFVAGGPDYCVLIALISNHRPIASALHAPATGQSWWAGDRAWKAADLAFSNVMPILRQPARTGGQIAVVSSVHAGEASRALCQKLKIADVKCENSALKFARLAEAEADIYPRIGRTMQWDIAAGDGLLRALGGGVFDLEGRPLTYGPGADGWANPDFIALRAAPAAVSDA